jgi:hypothetical protein
LSPEGTTACCTQVLAMPWAAIAPHPLIPPSLHALQLLNTLGGARDVAPAFLQPPLLGRVAYTVLQFVEILVGPRCQQMQVGGAARRLRGWGWGLTPAVAGCRVGWSARRLRLRVCGSPTQGWGDDG